MELRQRRRQRQRERQKINNSGLISKTITLRVHHAFFVHFFCRFCKVKVLKFMFCRGRKHKTTTFFIFPALWHIPLDDKVWSGANSLFKRRFRSRRRRCCLSSLMNPQCQSPLPPPPTVAKSASDISSVLYVTLSDLIWKKARQIPNSIRFPSLNGGSRWALRSAVK